MGLTALDVILYLTEGQGGRFAVDAVSSRLVYHASGREPSRIVPFGNTGLFTFARPFNAKEKDHATLEHKPVFLTRQAIDRLRESVGTPQQVAPIGMRRQLDYEHDIHPLVLLEMALIYYTTLLCEAFGAFLENKVRPGYEAFLAGGARHCNPEAATWMLVAPIEAAVNEAFTQIGAALRTGAAVEESAPRRQWDFRPLFERYVTVVFGGNSAGNSSAYGHSIDPQGNRFSWNRMIQPICHEQCSSPEAYRAALAEFMDRAGQGRRRQAPRAPRLSHRCPARADPGCWPGTRGGSPFQLLE
jgi:hypothetical protein